MSPLYCWPAAASVERIIPKERLYSESGISAGLRQRFIEEVQQVRWAYKLGDESLRLKGSDEVPEIQVFEIDLKALDLAEQVLSTIDKSVPSPIVFELHRTQAGTPEARLVAAHKAGGPRGPKLSDYFWGEWTPTPADRTPLPPAIDLTALYVGILASLLPVGLRRGEDLSAGIDRMSRISSLDREISTLSKRIGREVQLNRKIEMRRVLRARQAELDTAKNEADTTTPTTENATWRS